MRGVKHPGQLMSFASAASLVPALLLCGMAVAAASILDDPDCTRTMTPAEVQDLKTCIARGPACAKYWPSQADDLQHCDAAVTWLRTALKGPLAQRYEMFGGEPPAAATSILDDPNCTQTMTPGEVSDLKSCIARGPACAKYWPSQADDLQHCDAAVTWLRTALKGPLAQRNEMFGADPAAEPAWKKLPRSGTTTAPPRFDVTQSASTDPYAATSAGITPEAAKQAGWDVGVLTGAIKAGGQVLQDQAALDNPEAAMEAKQILQSVGLGEYAASDQAIGGAMPPQGNGGDYEQYYAKYSRSAQLACSSDVSPEFRSRWSRFTDPDLSEFYRSVSRPGQVEANAKKWAPRVSQYSLRDQNNELGRGYFQALEAARRACQITVACADGDAEYARFPMALSSSITTHGRVGVETGALVALQVAYAALQMNAEFTDEYSHYIRECMGAAAPGGPASPHGQTSNSPYVPPQPSEVCPFGEPEKSRCDARNAARRRGG